MPTKKKSSKKAAAKKNAKKKVALPGQLFYTTQIPVYLWFLTKNKNGRDGSPSRPLSRMAQALFKSWFVAN